jgi:hypothetical protein
MFCIVLFVGEGVRDMGSGEDDGGEGRVGYIT